MGATIESGWLRGSLRDDTGKEWPIERFPQASRGPLSVADPDLCLHTTEVDVYIPELRYPSQWQCGTGIIGQHIELGMQGDASVDMDGFLQQVELVGDSQLGLWLPKESTLGPAVALVAWLHRTKRIRTGLSRPNADWPLVLDRGPQANTEYYRRHDGTWRHPGVYGHVELPRNKHWDPGSFNYPRFFERVRTAILVQETDMSPEQMKKLVNFLEGVDSVLDPDANIAARRLGERVGRGVLKAEAGTAGASCGPDCDCRALPAALVRFGDTVRLAGV